MKILSVYVVSCIYLLTLLTNVIVKAKSLDLYQTSRIGAVSSESSMFIRGAYKISAGNIVDLIFSYVVICALRVKIFH